MKIRALKSFSGALSMAAGDVTNCNREDVVKDLVKAGYAEIVEENAQVAPVQPETPQESEALEESETSEKSETTEESETPKEMKKTGRKRK